MIFAEAYILTLSKTRSPLPPLMVMFEIYGTVVLVTGSSETRYCILSPTLRLCVRVSACICVHACECACMRTCVRLCMRARAYASMGSHVRGGPYCLRFRAPAKARLASSATDGRGVLLLQLLRSLMDKAVSGGLNVVRAWTHAVSPEYALQPSPGQYNEAVFRGLDYVLDEARKRKLKVRLSMSWSGRLQRLGC